MLYPKKTDVRKGIAVWSVAILLPFVFLVMEEFRRGKIWRVGGMTLTGKPRKL